MVKRAQRISQKNNRLLSGVKILQDKDGRGEIRTHERISPQRLFESRALNRSATLP